MSEDFALTLAELEVLQFKMAQLLADPKLLNSSIERKTITSGLVLIDKKVVSLRALLAAATDPTFRNSA